MSYESDLIKELHNIIQQSRKLYDIPKTYLDFKVGDVVRVSKALRSRGASENYGEIFILENTYKRKEVIGLEYNFECGYYTRNFGFCIWLDELELVYDE